MLNKNNKKIISLEEHKKIANDILRDIKNYCDTKEIIYYIAFGTALGAIRHKGFIPWDDDIDIIMPRIEYEKFKREYNRRKSKYRLVCNEINSDFWAPLPKVIDTTTVLRQTNVRDPKPIGIYVDVFVYDNIPENNIVRWFYFKKMKFIQKCWSFIRYKRNYGKYSPIGILYNFLICHVDPNILIRKIHILAQKYNNQNTTFFGCNEYSSFKHLYKKEWFEGGTNVIFEGIEFRTAKNWDAFLHCVYGDYMTLPPKNQRISTHPLEAYYKEN